MISEVKKHVSRVLIGFAAVTGIATLGYGPFFIAAHYFGGRGGVGWLLLIYAGLGCSYGAGAIVLNGIEERKQKKVEAVKKVFLGATAEERKKLNLEQYNHARATLKKRAMDYV